MGSLMSQTYSDFEVVVVDDASCDSTVEILQKLVKKDQRVGYFVQDENSGTLATRARGVVEAKGEYILLLDQDDELKPETLEKIHKELDENPVDILHFGVEVAPESEGARKVAKDSENWLTPEPRSLFGKDILKNQYCELGNFDFLVHHKAFKSKLAKKSWKIYEEVSLCAADDFLMCFILDSYANSYCALANSKWYVYHLGAGETFGGDFSFASWRRICDVEAKALSLINAFVEKYSSDIDRDDWSARVNDCQNKLIEHVMNEMHDKLSMCEVDRCIDYALQSWTADAVAGELWRFVRDRAYDDLMKHVDSAQDEILIELVKHAKKADSFVRNSSNLRYLRMKEIANVHLCDLETSSSKSKVSFPLVKFLRSFRKG